MLPPALLLPPQKNGLGVTMPFLSQHNLPRLWLIFQYFIGGTKDKQSVALSAYKSTQRVLEVGCSVGNIADAFRSIEGVDYTGIDIDIAAINTAQARFADTPQFKFLGTSIEEHAKDQIYYDYILVAGMLHHVDDSTAVSILKTVKQLAAPHAIINIFDPDAVTTTDPLYMRLFYKLEQGQYLRSSADLAKLITSAGLVITEQKTFPIRPGIPLFPAVARFSCFLASCQK